MDGAKKFKDGDWYRCRIEPGGRWDVIGREGTVVFNADLLVLGGEMEGETLPWPTFVTKKTKESTIAKFDTIFSFDMTGTDLAILEDDEKSPLVGKEIWAKCSIGPRPNGGFYPPKAGDIVSLNDRVPGGPAHKAALILGNTATKAPDPQAFADNF
jgi:hypothetical protein